jgi:PAS domain S-box-containing protein
MLRKRGDEMFSALIANSADGIYIISLQGIEYVNPAFEALVGRTAEEICGPGFDFLDLVHPDDRTLVAGAKGPLYEFRFVEGDGTVRSVEASTAALSGGDERTLVILRETTARRRASSAGSPSRSSSTRLSAATWPPRTWPSSRARTAGTWGTRTRAQSSRRPSSARTGQGSASSSTPAPSPTRARGPTSSSSGTSPTGGGPRTSLGGRSKGCGRPWARRSRPCP